MELQVWHTLVVRLWRDGDGDALKVRFLAGQTGEQEAEARVATTIESATSEFEQWLRSTDPKRSGRHGDDGGATDAETSPS